MKCSMYDHIVNINSDNLNTVAINYYGTKLKYKDLFKKIDRVAEALVAHGIAAGDIVTICALNSPEAVYLVYALNKIGAVANLVYGISSVDELNTNVPVATHYQLNECRYRANPLKRPSQSSCRGRMSVYETVNTTDFNNATLSK